MRTKTPSTGEGRSKVGMRPKVRHGWGPRKCMGLRHPRQNNSQEKRWDMKANMRK